MVKQFIKSSNGVQLSRWDITSPRAGVVKRLEEGTYANGQPYTAEKRKELSEMIARLDHLLNQFN